MLCMRFYSIWQIKVDDVVVTVGLQPNDDIAKTSELDIDPMRGGVMANAELEAKPNIWVVSIQI